MPPKKKEEEKKGPGRPETEVKDIQINLRLPPSLHKKYLKRAEKEGLPISTYIRSLLVKMEPGN